jgi:hypothetical protein
MSVEMLPCQSLRLASFFTALPFSRSINDSLLLSCQKVSR